MEKELLEKNGYIVKLIGPTPAGGDYSEAHFFDDKGNYTSKDQSTNITIRECLNDGTLVKETFMQKKEPSLTDEEVKKK